LEVPLESSAELEPLLQRLRSGDKTALGELFNIYRDQIRRMVEFRLDARLNGRVSCSDVLQETYIDAMQRLDHFLKKPNMPFHVWLRLVASQRIVDVHRQHLGAQMRSAENEVHLEDSVIPQVSSVILARCLATKLESPSQVAMRKELLSHVERAFNNMDPLDREVLALRHFEELTNDEVAAYLGLQKSAASNRYIRALRRLKEELSSLEGSGVIPPMSEHRDGGR
jgi:RNA polymerase sigma-70 factor (ECF subfamily)